MKFGKVMLVIGLAAIVGSVAASAPSRQEPDPTPSPDGGKVEGKGWPAVEKLMKVHCVSCHGEHGRAGFDARTYESIMKGYEDGPLVVAGDVDKSVLALALRGKKDYRKMPPKRGIALSEEQIKAIEAWIKDGAKKDAPPVQQ